MGDYTTWAVHMNGLAKMADARGGLMALNQYLQEYICM
jgi:hypothetical protein